MVFTQGRGFVLGASFGLLIVRSVVAFWLATPRTPPLWQRDFFLVNCSVLRSLLASVRSGVVKTLRCATYRIEMAKPVRNVSVAQLTLEGAYKYPWHEMSRGEATYSASYNTCYFGGKTFRKIKGGASHGCLLYTSPSPRDLSTSRMPSSA